jgi:hypothetical protein
MNAGWLRSNDLRLIQEGLTKEQKDRSYDMKRKLSTRRTKDVRSATGGGNQPQEVVAQAIGLAQDRGSTLYITSLLSYRASYRKKNLANFFAHASSL